MFCIECGQQLPDSARFCSHCGRMLEGVAQEASSPQFIEAVNVYRDIEEIMAEDAWVAESWGLLSIADQNELRIVWAFIQRNGPGSETVKKQLSYYRQLVCQPKRAELQREIAHLKEEQDVAARVLSKEWLVRAGAKHTEKCNEFQRWLRLETCVQSLYLEVFNADNGVVQAEAVVLNDEGGMLAWPASSVERWVPRLPGLEK
jgi:hypothetical protein